MDVLIIPLKIVNILENLNRVRISRNFSKKDVLRLFFYFPTTLGIDLLYNGHYNVKR